MIGVVCPSAARGEPALSRSTRKEFSFTLAIRAVAPRSLEVLPDSDAAGVLEALVFRT